ncbi:cytochrome P450 [Nocardia jiangsuensis]|uniref:Cytochrome P450 n=1 Tax=Nocardia jiangsuensis TaxID=1691563 RepID=A0ABV8DZN4_9NOCA
MTAIDPRRAEPVPTAPRGPRIWVWPALLWGMMRRGDDLIDEQFDRYGDVVWLPLPRFPHFLPGGAQLVLLRDPALIKPLFTAPDELVDSAGANRALELLYGDRSLFLLNGPDHRRLRRVLLPGLRGDALATWATFIADSAERETRTWFGRDRVLVHPSMLDLSLELILKMSLSIPDAEMSRWMPPMRELLATATSPQATFRYGLRQLGGLRLWRGFRRVRARCDELVFGEIARRRAHPEIEHSDLLDLLLRAEGEPLTDRELRDQLFTILIGGHETSATLASWVLERLVYHPDIYARAIAEARDGTGHEYMDAIVQETLRLRPPLAFVGRITRRNFALGEHVFPPNTLILPVIRAVHRSAELYPDPEVFRPERFLESRRTPFGHIPFGGGPHRCLGDHMGVFQTRSVVQSILRIADLSGVAAGGGERIRRKALVLVPAQGGILRATPLGRREGEAQMIKNVPHEHD